MRFWRRKPATDNTVLPQEVQDYYTAEKRERRGMAGLLAIGTLLATILLAVGLFFGGRWAYRSIRHQGKNTAGTTKTATSSATTSVASNGVSGSSTNSTSSNNDATTPTSPSNTTLTRPFVFYDADTTRQ